MTPIRILEPVKYGAIALLPVSADLYPTIFSVDDAFASDWISAGKASPITPTESDMVTELIYQAPIE